MNPAGFMWLMCGIQLTVGLITVDEQIHVPWKRPPVATFNFICAGVWAYLGVLFTNSGM